MAELDYQSDSENKKDKAREDSDSEITSSSLGSDLWRGRDIALLHKDKASFDLGRAGFPEMTLTGLDAAIDNSTHQRVREESKTEKSLDKSEVPLDPKRDLEKRYGVEIREKDGRYEYVLKANGKETVLFDSDKSAEALREAEQKLRDTAEAKMKELEEKYGIQITREGEEVKGFGHGSDRDTVYHGRTPTLRELTALEEALKRSADTRVTNDPSKPLTVTFVREESFAFGFYNPDSNHLFMFTSHDGRDKIPPTPEDREKERAENEPPDLRHIILHELAHHSQMSFQPDRKTREKENKDMGWVESKEKEKDGSPKYEYLGKDGYQYELKLEKDGTPKWYRKDADGSYVDANGKKVDSLEKAHSLSSKEMREQALVPPASDYFFHPIEQQADNLTLLRTGNDVRGKFIRDNYDLYKATKETDQRHLDSVFGRNADGSSKMIRLPDGSIAPNSKENQERIADFEKFWRK